jgi:hypothetical protein
MKKIAFIIGLILVIFVGITAVSAREFQTIAYSGSVFRDGFISAFGLLKGEAVASYIDLDVKPPSEFSHLDISTNESNYGVGINDRFYVRGYRSESEIIGTTRAWKVDGSGYAVGYKLKVSPNNHSALGLECEKRTLDSGPIFFRSTGIAETTFLDDGKIRSVKLVDSINIDEKTMIHYMIGGSKSEYYNISKKSTFAGFGYDRRIKGRFDWQNSAIYIKTEDRPKTFYLSSRLVYRLFKGLSVSLEGSMYTDGYTVAPFRFSDHFVPGMAISPARLPSSYKALETKAFGFYGIGIHYGIKF